MIHQIKIWIPCLLLMHLQISYVKSASAEDTNISSPIAKQLKNGISPTLFGITYRAASKGITHATRPGPSTISNPLETTAYSVVRSAHSIDRELEDLLENSSDASSPISIAVEKAQNPIASPYPYKEHEHTAIPFSTEAADPLPGKNIPPSTPQQTATVLLSMEESNLQEPLLLKAISHEILERPTAAGMIARATTRPQESTIGCNQILKHICTCLWFSTLAVAGATGIIVMISVFSGH